ncbi:MAG TPA: MerR family transcriptional regulator [Arachnia sp.]|nr:MerR family transcriptional regulator [Arachnia sp.]
MTQPDSAPTLQIGAVAERTGLSIRTLRHYDEVGLVRPSGRSVGGFRLYTHDDVSRLLLIRRMKPLGFSLEEMVSLLETADAHRALPTADTAAALADYVRVASERRDDLALQVAKADEFIAQLRGLGGDSASS